MEAYINCDIFTGETVLSDHALLVEGSNIHDIVRISDKPDDASVIDLCGAFLMPGYVDMQANGGGGVLLNNNADVEALLKVLDAHTKFGTTHLFPTVFTCEFERMEQLFNSAMQLRKSGETRIAGLHFEGPIINQKKAGIHDKSKIKRAEKKLLDLYIRSAAVMPTLVTLAPEMVEPKVITELHEAGVLIFAGHSDATYDQMKTAKSAGLSGVTHLYNACSGPASREPGVAGFAMSDDDSLFSIIVDGYHVHWASVDIALKSKAAGKVILVTDAMPALGHEVDSFFIGKQEVFVSDGRCHTAEGVLAGSALDMATAVRNCVQKVGVNRLEAVRMATHYPAVFAGIGDQVGEIKPGYVASFVITDNEFNVKQTIVAGSPTVGYSPYKAQI